LAGVGAELTITCTRLDGALAWDLIGATDVLIRIKRPDLPCEYHRLGAISPAGVAVLDPKRHLI